MEMATCTQRAIKNVSLGMHKDAGHSKQNLHAATENLSVGSLEVSLPHHIAWLYQFDNPTNLLLGERMGWGGINCRHLFPFLSPPDDQ